MYRVAYGCNKLVGRHHRDVQYLISSYANRSYTQMLTLTPCDMWPYLAGRTLWVIGDRYAHVG